MFKTTDISQSLQRLLIYSQGTSELVSSLSDGEELEAKVIRYTEPGRVLISLKNLKVTAEVKLPFHEGEKIQVKVESLAPRIVLKLISRNAAFRNAYLKLGNKGIPDNRGIPDIFHELRDNFINANKLNFSTNKESIEQLLRNILNIFDFTESGFTSERIRQLLKNFTLSYEREIIQQAASGSQQISSFNQKKDNLKLLLLKLLELLIPVSEGDDESEVLRAKNLSRLIRGFSHSIDILNIQKQQSDIASLPMKVPIVYADEEGYVDIIMGFKDKDGEPGEERDFRITMSTELSGLGKLKVSILLKGTQIFSSITSSEGDVADFLQDNLQSLVDSICNLGFDDSNLNINILYDGNPETYNIDSIKFSQRIPLVDFHI